MPTVQPMVGKFNILTNKPGSVGVLVAALLVVVSCTHHRPQPCCVKGKLVILDPTVMQGYLDNPDANNRSFFYLALPVDGNPNQTLVNYCYFLVK